jgi:hypothetical protein
VSWQDLGAAIYTRAIADTSSGGLFESGGAAEIAAVFINVADEDAPFFPKGHVVVSHVSTTPEDAFASAVEHWEYGWQADILTARAGLALPASYHEAVAKRWLTLFRRFTLTVAGWTVSDSFVESRQEMQIDGEALRTTIDFTTTLSK